MTDLPSGTVTFLFSDIEGSTRLWEEHPDAMRTCLALHDEIMRTAVTAHDGVIVKTTGDGVHAAFPTAAGGVAAAIDAQRAVAGAEWDAIGGLKVRIGLHTGEAELRDGDYYGSDLNRAARLMSVAHGDQIVVSQLTAGLVRGSLPGGVELVDLGEHRLRDVAAPIEVFQVAHPDLTREFPRLRSLQDVGNLPTQLTSFVGREDEVDALVDAVAEVHLVTLTGTGGVGKTRLALRVAAEVAPDFADGAWVCELAAADDEVLMSQVIADSLGSQQRAGLSLVESIVEFLRVRNLLLVLDNCEHLLDAAGDFAAAVLRGCPHIRVLATSREALEVDGERVVRVRSLGERAAAQLFEERARDVGANATWTGEQQRAIVEICERVDGIPLAIELAAARADAMSPVEIAAHLDERFRILTGRRRGRVERQQTLRATVDWSYQLLADDERAVFDRVGIFSGSFDAEAAGAVVSDPTLDPWQVRDAVANLVAKSMLVPEDGPGGTTRYSMLETLRVFARDQLDQSGESDSWRRRHAACFADFAEAFARGSQGSEDQLWMRRTVAELDNVRAAIAWGLDRDDRDDVALAVRILVGLAPYAQWNRSTSIDALAVRALQAMDDSPPDSRAAVLALASYHELNQGGHGRALELARRAVREIEPRSLLLPFPYINLMFTELMTGEHERAQQIIDEGLIAFATADPYAQASFFAVAATFLALLGRDEQAHDVAEQALQLAKSLGNRTLIVQSLSCTAWSLQRHEPEAALAIVEELLALVGDSEMSGVESTILALGGGLRSRLGDHVGAFELLAAAARLCRDDGARPQLASVLDWSIAPLVKTERSEVAVVFLGALTGGQLADVSYYFHTGTQMRDRAIRQLRSELGDQRVDVLLAQGASMAFEEIVVYALEQLARVR